MLNSWFSSKSSRRRSPLSVHNNVQQGPSNASYVSLSTVEPVQTSVNLTSASDIPLEEVHAHINDPSTYAPTPSLIHSAEKDTGTPRTLDAPVSSLGATTYQPEHTTTATRVAQHVPEGTLFTPQDAILAQVFGKTAPPTPHPVHDTPPPPASSALQPSVTTESARMPASVPPVRTQSGSMLTIYEPFSGARLSDHQTPISPPTVTPREHASSAPLSAADDHKLWASLERILELQAEIAAMHADIEGVGRGPGASAHVVQAAIPNISAGEGVAGPRKRSKRGQTLPIGDEEPEEHEPLEGGVTGVAASDTSSERFGEEEDDDDDDGVHAYGKKRRDEEFAKLAEQFAQRKAAIGGIMNKLDALSTALKTFHTIPPPLFDLAMSPNRSDIVSLPLSGVSAAPSPPLPHARPSFSSSPPSQAVHPITPSMVPLSPPIPPISTLSPPGSPGDPTASRHVVAPVLPKMAFPTIIPGAPHMDSPADMDHVQSIFQKVR